MIGKGSLLVGQVVAVVSEGANEPERRFVVHWFGNNAGILKGPHRPGFVDSADNKLVFGPKRAQGRGRYSPWTSALTKQRVTQGDILLVEPKLSSGNKLLSEDLNHLENCPFLSWARPEGDFFQA